jgi:hypothetical protein
MCCVEWDHIALGGGLLTRLDNPPAMNRGHFLQMKRLFGSDRVY